MIILLSVLFTESKAYLNLIVDFIIPVLTLLYLVDRIFFSSGDAGGQLGLVLGASFITILEVIDLVVMFAINWFRSTPRTKNTEI